MQIDSYGDNALHQVAAGNHYDTFKLLQEYIFYNFLHLDENYYQFYINGYNKWIRIIFNVVIKTKLII